MKGKDLSQKYIRPIGQTRYPLGRDALSNLAEKSGAVRRVGKLVFYNCEMIDAYIEEHCKDIAKRTDKYD
jgi:hypothetical protein